MREIAGYNATNVMPYSPFSHHSSHHSHATQKPSLPQQIFAGIKKSTAAGEVTDAVTNPGSSAAAVSAAGQDTGRVGSHDEVDVLVVPPRNPTSISPSQRQQEGANEAEKEQPTVAAEAPSMKVVPVTFAWCLHAYILTRVGAQRLVSLLPVYAPVDIFVASLLSATDGGVPRLTGRAVLPVLASAGGANAPGGDVVSSGTNRAGVADGGKKKNKNK